MRPEPHALRVRMGTDIHSISVDVVCAPYTKVSRTRSQLDERDKCSSHSIKARKTSLVDGVED